MDVVWDKDPLGSGCTESCGMGTPVRDGQRRRKRTPMAAFYIWFRSRVDGVKEWKTQEEDCGKTKAADEDLQFCHLQMPIVLDGRSVLEQTNERIRERWETSASVGRGERRTETVDSEKREREAQRSVGRRKRRL